MYNHRSETGTLCSTHPPPLLRYLDAVVSLAPSPTKYRVPCFFCVMFFFSNSGLVPSRGHNPNETRSQPERKARTSPPVVHFVDNSTFPPPPLLRNPQRPNRPPPPTIPYQDARYLHFKNVETCFYLRASQIADSIFPDSVGSTEELEFRLWKYDYFSSVYIVHTHTCNLYVTRRHSAQTSSLESGPDMNL